MVARRVLANERRAENRRAALAERMRAMPARQPDGEAAGRGELLEAALARLPERDREALALLDHLQASGAPSPPIPDPAKEAMT